MNTSELDHRTMVEGVLGHVFRHVDDRVLVCLLSENLDVPLTQRTYLNFVSDRAPHS